MLQLKEGKICKRRSIQEERVFTKWELESDNSKSNTIARLSMCNLPRKYKSGGDGLCNLCEEEEGSTEHYLNDCNQAQIRRKVWEVNMQSARSWEK